MFNMKKSLNERFNTSIKTFKDTIKEMESIVKECNQEINNKKQVLGNTYNDITRLETLKVDCFNIKSNLNKLIGGNDNE